MEMMVGRIANAAGGRVEWALSLPRASSLLLACAYARRRGPTTQFPKRATAPPHPLKGRAFMSARVFVDGQDGTTGLRIHEVLAAPNDVELLQHRPRHGARTLPSARG